MPRLVVFTDSEKVHSDIHAVCASGGWVVERGSSDPSHWTHAEAPEVDAALFDLENPLSNAEELTKGLTSCYPFLPIIFLSREGLAQDEMGGGLRYHVDPGRLRDLEHILISLNVGFLSNGFLSGIEIAGNAVPRVLIVDDNVQLASLVERALRSLERFDVRMASSGYEAVAMLPSFNPDVAVIDLALGDMDGREVCTFIRNHGRLKETKVIGVSGYLSRERTDEDGTVFDAFLEKPFRMRDLLDKVVSFVRPKDN